MHDELQKRTIYKAYQRFKWLVLGSISGILISVLATIWLARLMGPENYGLYTMALIIPSIIPTIGDLGISRATIFYTASLRSDNLGRALEYFKSALLVACFQSALLVACTICLSDVISISVFNRKYLAPYLQVASLITFHAIVSGVINGGLISLEKQRIVALFTIAASLLRNSLALILYLQYREVIVALAGQAVGYSLVALTYLLYALKTMKSIDVDFKLAWPMLKYGIPYAIGMFMITMSFQMYNIVAASVLSNEVYGNFSAAWLIFSAASTIPTALSTAFFPSFSESIKMSEIIDTGMNATYNVAAKFSAIILVYLWLILGGFSDICVSIVYGSEYTLAGDILMLLMSVFVLSVLSWDVISPFLLSLKETRAVAMASLSGVGVSLLVFFIGQNFSPMSTLWLILSSIFILYSMYTLIGLAYLYRKYEIKLDKANVIKLFIIAILLFYSIKNHGLGARILLKVFGSSLEGYALVVGLAILWIGVVYLFVLALVGIIRREDCEILDKTILSLPLFSLVRVVVRKIIMLGIVANGSLKKLI